MSTCDLTNVWHLCEASNWQIVITPSLKEEIEFREVECVAKNNWAAIEWADIIVMVPRLVFLSTGINHIFSLKL